MAKRKPSVVAAMLRKAMLPGICLTLMAFFAAYAVLGQNGVLAYGDYQRALTAKQSEYAALTRQRAVLANRVRLVDPKRVNPDMADELVRSRLNVASPDEVIVPLHK